ncbi:hypothetical protein J2W24_001601 [Variovorax boronicumulans]|uniref:DUF6194 family protein n=1 Tax=Variovorax boronicumulans TaxID=436515 RepID=UPI000BB38D15|nr:DUF6194 family protein [Variovorax boronicumulans]MDP9915957.1 hypothetical protein [Variovorax boronicumulans]PBI93864.1 hypothetical protein BKP43_12700 [Variovorax boronicumulans]
MTEDDITQHLIDMLGGGHFEVADDNTFFFHGADNKFPFATIVTKDNEFDSASKLNRPGVFRLNVGVGKESFRALFGEQPPVDIDYTAIDRLMPHPVYAKMHWVSVINPSAATFETVKPLLTEARNLLIARDKGA